MSGLFCQDEATAGKYNIIVICLDALRADHVGCYGYARNTTPFLDELAKEGYVFDLAYAQSNFTLPSIASFFTSKYVQTHKADRIERRLSDDEYTLAEILNDQGYRTAAFIYNATQFDRRYGLDQGFEFYFFGEEDNREPSFEKTVPQCLKWIESHRSEPFFVFLHSNDIHEPYHSPYENFFDPAYKGKLDKEYFGSGNPDFHKNNLCRTPRETAHIAAHYDGGIKYADTYIGTLIRQLRQWDLMRKTIVIVFSDHGEILGDRGGRFYHGFSLHDEEVRVPLIVAYPGAARKGAHIAELVQLIDVMPTVLDFARIDSASLHMEGKSFVPLMNGRPRQGPINKYVFAECVSGESEQYGVINVQVMIRSLSWNFIASTWKALRSDVIQEPKWVKLHNGSWERVPGEDSWELYDLSSDPREQTDLHGKGHESIEADLLAMLLSMHSKE